MKMSPGLGIGLLGCLVGLAFQFVSLSAAVPGRELENGPRGGTGRGLMDDDDELPVAQSSRARRKSVRRVFFPFGDVALGGLMLGHVEPRTPAERFLVETEGAMDLFQNYDDSAQEYALMRSEGLGVKHPQIVEKLEERQSLADQLSMAWEAYLSFQSRGSRERIGRKKR